MLIKKPNRKLITEKYTKDNMFYKINELISKSFPQSPSTQHQQDIFNMFFVLDQKHGLKNYIKVNYKSDI